MTVYVVNPKESTDKLRIQCEFKEVQAQYKFVYQQQIH